MSESLRIVFAGTPEFAAEHLKALLDTPHQIIAVYSQPDRPAGRRQQDPPPPAPPARPARQSRASGTQAGSDGGGTFRPDPAASGALYPAPGPSFCPRP